VGGHRVNGIHGRYFIPLLPLVLLLCQDRLIRAWVEPAFLRTLTFAACGAILFIAVEAILFRYYEKASTWGVLPPRGAVAVAGVATVLVIVVQRYRWLLHKRALGETSSANPASTPDNGEPVLISPASLRQAG
jgi:hypothetical protein